MLNQGVGSWPFRRARLTPDATAIVFGDRRFSYRELDDRVTRLAHALRELGVGPGDRVALLSVNHPAYLEALFAAGLLNAILVPLNARLTVPEVVVRALFIRKRHSILRGVRRLDGAFFALSLLGLGL